MSLCKHKGCNELALDDSVYCDQHQLITGMVRQRNPCGENRPSRSGNDGDGRGNNPNNSGGGNDGGRGGNPGSRGPTRGG